MSSQVGAGAEFEVVVPTRNRPAKLDRCLKAIATARQGFEVPVLVCDSSDPGLKEAVAAVCRRHPVVTLLHHRGQNVAAARNFAVRSAAADNLISVDDDVNVEPGALAALAEHLRAAPRPAVVAGAVAWDGIYHRPVVIGPTGYGRPTREGERPSFVITALFAFPRELGEALPWNERIATSDDIFAGALWRSHGVGLEFAPEARAVHDPERGHYGVDTQESHIYVNLFDALMVMRSFRRALAYEFIGFAAGAKAYCRSPHCSLRFLRAWLRGHLALARDWRYLRELVRRELPAAAAGRA